MANLHFIIEGAEANKAAEQLKAILAASGADATISPISSAELPYEVRRVIDPITLIGVILAFPGAVLAVMDLADRIHKRKKAQAIIDAAQRVSNETKVQVNFVLPQGTSRGVDQITADELLDVAVKQNASAPGTSGQ
jgi:hypothetical protein